MISYGRRTRVRSGASRRRGLAVASAVAVLILAIAAVMPVPSLGGASVAVAAIQRAKSFVELMSQRSPGNRTVGHLAVTKQRKVALHERALPKIRKRPPVATAALPPISAELPPALVDLVAPPIPTQFARLEALPVGPLAQAPLFPFAPAATASGFVLPPTATPGSPPVVTPPQITPPVTTPAAVPEPGTWAMMLVGFGLTSWSLRRRRQREQIAA